MPSRQPSEPAGRNGPAGTRGPHVSNDANANSKRLVTLPKGESLEARDAGNEAETPVSVDGPRALPEPAECGNKGQMSKLFVWFCGTSAAGKTWLAEQCARSLELCRSLELPVGSLESIGMVGSLDDASSLEAIAASQERVFFIHWQTAYDRGGYGVQRLRELQRAATHAVIEIHRDEHERWLAFQKKPFIASAVDEDQRGRFINWPESDYATIRQHEGNVDVFVRVFLAANSVFRMEPVRHSPAMPGKTAT